MILLSLILLFSFSINSYFGGESLEGKILTNDSLEKCSYDNEAALCKTKEMSCLGESNSLIKQCK